MSRNDEFESGRGLPEVEISWMPADYAWNPSGKHTVLAHIGNEQVGSLQWDDDGNLDTIQVKTKHRRQGLATRMLHSARSIAAQNGLTPPTFAKEFTKLGEKWRKSTDLPEATESAKQGTLNRRYADPWKRR